MGPVLALELSTEGIFLHELSYDGQWRQAAAAGLADPSLPKKMSAMRATARASQGRNFKNEVWFPRDQMILTELQLSEDDPQKQQAEAMRLVTADPSIPAGDYIIRIGDEHHNGRYPIAIVDKSVVAEAIRFATGYGFGTDGITVPGKVAGFHDKPYFDSLSIAKPISVGLRRLGFYATAAAVLAGVGYGGWVFYDSIEFSPNPATVIEATEERVFSESEDPRAPIRPTAITPVTVGGATPLAVLDSENAPLANLDRSLDILSVQVGGTSLTSELTQIPAATPATGMAPITFWQEAPLQPSESRPDALPAPETTGFETTSPVLVSANDVILTPNIALQLADTPYQSATNITLLDQNLALPDRLPAEESTVVLAALERKLNEDFGLTQVRDNDAEQLRLARLFDFQNVTPTVTTGRPEILPTLRSGADVSEIIEVPEVELVVAPTAPSLFELQRLAPIVEAGLPPITPILRGGVEIGAEPVEVVTADPVAEPDLTLSELQALPPVIEDGRPEITPTLREGAEIGAEPVPDTPVADAETEDLDITPENDTPVQQELTLAELQTLPPIVEDGRPPITPTLREGLEIGAAPPPAPLTIAELQALEPEVISGLPPIVPITRVEPEAASDEAVLASADPVVPLTLEELQNLAPDVVSGAPEIIPTLREVTPPSDGSTPDTNAATEAEPDATETDITDGETPDAVEATEPARELTLAELQNLAPIVETGRPQITPTLRTGEPVETVILSPAEEAERIAALQAEDPLVLEGRPTIVPQLREDLDLGEGTGTVAPEIVLPDQTDAARYRPVFRPESIVEIARLNDPTLSEVAVVTSTAPALRSADFASKVESMIASFEQAPIVTEPRFDDTPREVNLPTSASVAAAATLEEVINLRATNLIGVFGQPGSYRAMIRQPGGRYLTVTIGESIGDGWRVVGIDESSIRVQKGSRTETLRVPG